VRRFVYALAAVVALAPLAAIAPASAAVQRPAAPRTVCSGHEEALIHNQPSPGASNTSYWYVSPTSGNINDAHASMSEFCVVPEGKISNNYAFEFRQEGTSNCATPGPGPTVTLTGCSAPISTIEWQITHPGPQTGEIANVYATEEGADIAVAGVGGDKPLTELIDGSDPAEQDWTIDCIANSCSL
jgi:putative hemolysin